MDLTLGDPGDHSVLESVNGRLRVYVEGEDGAPSEDAFRARGTTTFSTILNYKVSNYRGPTVLLWVLLLWVITSTSVAVMPRV